MRRVCLKCEGVGVLRTYLNHAGDYKKRHCEACKGTGKEPRELPPAVDAVDPQATDTGTPSTRVTSSNS
jgi:hypothetical protein